MNNLYLFNVFIYNEIKNKQKNVQIVSTKYGF